VIESALIVCLTVFTPQSVFDGKYPYLSHAKRLHGIHSLGVDESGNEALHSKFRKNPSGQSIASCIGHGSHHPFWLTDMSHPTWYVPSGHVFSLRRSSPIPAQLVALTHTVSLVSVHFDDSVIPGAQSEHPMHVPTLPIPHASLYSIPNPAHEGHTRHAMLLWALCG
jgi:hypothetical protein